MNDQSSLIIFGSIITSFGINLYINYKNKKILDYYNQQYKKNELYWEAPDKLDILECKENENELRRKSLEICCRLVAKWRKNPPIRSKMKFMIIQGGITNKLYRITDNNNYSVLIRIYGEKTEMLIDRDVENRVFAALTKEHFGPPLIGCFNGGRIEGWLNAHALKPQSMADPYFQKKIAIELNRMHYLNIPLKREITLWNVLNKWLNIVKHIQFSDEKKNEQLNGLQINEIEEDLKLWIQLLTDANSPIVFCHNDLLSGNILYDSDNDKIYFVDFEYGNYNTRAFDIANHFCEYCGYELDLDKFPSPDEQRNFYSAYLNCQLDDPLVDSLYEEVKLWYAMPHLYWGLWSIVQARYSSIDFDFLDYAALRLNEYRCERSKIKIFEA